ncbi:HNH endonuclease [candidate division WOR-3 bacterium]|nr:HNH endonuclease [candidate division WOR-3 bacterium]
MVFKKSEIEELLVKTGRRCCICGKLHDVQVHHIIPKGEDGSDDIDNAITLCPNCHDEVHSYAPGRTTRKYSANDLKLHRQETIERAKAARELYPQLRQMSFPVEMMRDQEWVATFGLDICEVFEKDMLPPNAPRDYLYLCDWLTDDLMKRLSRAVLDLRFLEDARDGETLSIRVGFKWNLDKSPLDFGDISWWEVLEVDEYDRIYPS